MNMLLEKRIYEMLLEKFGSPLVDDPESVDYCPDCGYSHEAEKELADAAHKKMGNKKDNDEIDELDESTPKGFEKVVKALKKQPGVNDAWAVANAMKNKGIKPKK